MADGMPIGPAPLAASPSEGIKTVVKLKLAMAVRALTDALGAMGEVTSDEGRAVLRALQALAPVTPQTDEGVSQSELLGMIARAGAPPSPALGPLGLPAPVPRPLGAAAAFPPRPVGSPFGLAGAGG